MARWSFNNLKVQYNNSLAYERTTARSPHNKTFAHNKNFVVNTAEPTTV